MRAIAIDRFGGLEVMAVTDVPEPLPGANDVRIRMAYAGVNPADWKLREGWLNQLAVFRPTFPFVMGYDGAGIVDRVGDNVQYVKPGDRVLVKSDQSLGRWGTFAEMMCVADDMVGPIPHEMSLAEAATMPVAGLTAWHGLFLHGALKAGQSLFVNAGAGAVGVFAVQFARRAGARVMASCSPRNAEYMKGFGAEECFDYRDPSLAAAVTEHAEGPVDLVLDAGPQCNHDLTRLLVSGGAYVRVPSLGPDDALPDIQGVHLINGGIVRAKAREAYAAMMEIYRAGDLRLPDIEVLPVEEAARGLAINAAGSQRGKVLLKIWQ